MNPEDRKHLKLMLQQLRTFDWRSDDMGWLLSSLETLRTTLEGAPEDWLRDFEQTWGRLEESYMLFTEPEVPSHLRPPEQDVSGLLDQLATLIDRALHP